MLKNVLTLGPASSKQNIISALLSVADRFRLNTSHITVNELSEWLSRIEKVFTASEKFIPVVIDLQGSKMRIGKYQPVDTIPEHITLSFKETSLSPEVIPVPHEALFKFLNEGDTVSLNDARITLKITEVNINSAKAITIKNGPLSSNKGINRKEHPIPFHELASKDSKMIRAAKKYNFTEFAFSFAYSGNEADKIRPYTGKHRIIAKIERAETFANLESIDKCFDEIWLCRGDLGAQVGIFNLGKLQKTFIQKINSLNKNCFLAGQVLEHMTSFPEPTRSEIVHLFDTEQNGFKGFVLSDETAIGKNIPSIVDFLETYKG